jgi:acyl-CoA dehydrogenase
VKVVMTVPWSILGLAIAATVALGVPLFRRLLVTRWLMRAVSKTLSPMSETERVALDAGTVWWDGELFSGDPDWPKLLAFPRRSLSVRERAFLDGPVEQLCGMLDDWEVAQHGDLPSVVWSFLKQHRFLGMIIPEEYGGLGFSASAHSAVVTKIASRSVTAAVTVMVPNSLGPAELLLHYGTDQQKRHYLPRLAAGEEIPCFALTGPEAGSDAAATRSEGVVCRASFEGRQVLGMRLNWSKRYITLGPVSTVIGLAFKLRDPERLLGGEQELGITCALVPSQLAGIDIGRRHDPMGIAFQNGPNEGHDVFVPLDFIIGGRAMAGQGWRMLMESLAAGRSISLPALSVGAAELAARVAGAYAAIREQFGMPIGRFEGVGEALARIGGRAYLMNAARTLTAAAVDAGERPSVVSAIVKAQLTEGMRLSLMDAMDIQAGAGICRGPRNVLAQAYTAAPIGITVEGANILTRSLIIFGQGALRCHPFLRDEMAAMAQGDLERFERAFFAHVGFVLRNAVRALVRGLTDGRFARPRVEGPMGPYLGRLSRLSAAFALVSDAALASLGGALKRREAISGRLADALSWLYLGSAAIKRFHDDGKPAEDLPLLRWSCDHALRQVQEALVGVLDNFPNGIAARALRMLAFPLGARYRAPSDALGGQAARTLLEDGEARRRLTADIYVPASDELGLGRLEAAFRKATRALSPRARMRDAVRSGALRPMPAETLPDRALAARLISVEELRTIQEADAAREDVIAVDSFAAEAYPALRRPSGAIPRVPIAEPVAAKGPWAAASTTEARA